MVCLLLCAACAGAAENGPRASCRYAPDALWEMDLASDTAWTLSINGGAPRPIKVATGGWKLLEPLRLQLLIEPIWV